MFRIVMEGSVYATKRAGLFGARRSPRKTGRSYRIDIHSGHPDHSRSATLSNTALLAPAAAMPDPDTVKQCALAALEDMKAKDVANFDVRGRSAIADHMLIASGTSTRHVKSIADRVVTFAKEAGVRPLGIEGDREAEWVLVDLGDVIVHVMLPRTRSFYNLEKLYAGVDDSATSLSA